MFKRTAVVLVIAAISTSCNMWKNTAPGWPGATGGEKLERLFWDDVKNKDFRSLESHLGPTFTGSGPSGPVDRAAFLQQLHSYQLSSVSLSECIANLNGADVTITCKVRREGSPAGLVSTLSVWQEYQKGWIMVAHAETPLSN